MADGSNKYKHFEDERTKNEINITDVLIETVSNYNIQLHQPNEYICTHANKDILTIAINGIPPDKREFQGFTFTKRFVNYILPCFEFDQTEEFYAKRIYDANLETVMKEIDDIVVANGNRVVFASHSSGSYIVTAYIHYHPEKVFGIIEFGAIPATFYHSIKSFGYRYILSKGYSPASLLEKKDFINQQYRKWMGEHGNSGHQIQNTYAVVAFYSIFNAEVLKVMFSWRRNYPDILKLITFGRRDGEFHVSLLNEVAYHYAYGAGALSQNYNKKMSEKYKAVTNFETSNVQERFVYSFPKAGHGLHLTRKKALQNLVNLYLALMLDREPEAATL